MPDWLFYVVENHYHKFITNTQISFHCPSKSQIKNDNYYVIKIKSNALCNFLLRIVEQ